jgi:hypothetical protein
MKEGIFISHLGEEKLVAVRVKELLREAFGPNVKVFVSSDYDSIRSGSDWHGDIITALKSSRVVLILCSADSVSRPWINYEAGVGDGTDSDVKEVGRTNVIPLVVRNFPKGKLQPPLSRKHARDAHDADDVEALLKHISEDVGEPHAQTDVQTFVKEMREISRRIQVRDDRLSLSDADFETYIKNLITAQNGNEFSILIEDLREQTVDCWNGEWSNSPEALRQRVGEVKSRFLPALHKLTLLGVLLIKYAQRPWFTRIAHTLEQIFRVSNKLGTLSAFSYIPQNGPESKSLDDHLSHTVPALEALLSTYVIGAYAVTREYGLVDVMAFFPRVVSLAAGPYRSDQSIKKPMLFWPIEFGWGYPNDFRYNLAIQRYGGSERINNLFGGAEGMKSALLQLDCYIEWNSFLCVEPPVVKEIREYLEEFCKGITFGNYPHFIFEKTNYIAPIVQTLWDLAGSPATHHASGLTLDTNIGQRLVNMGPQKRRELFSDFVLYAQQQRATYCRQKGHFAEFFPWPTDLIEAVKAAKSRREEPEKS